jgi:DNA mismatch repair protein MutL
MPPDAVDVNVHPTKAEVRFREQSLIHEVVRRTLMDALGTSTVPELRLQADPVVPPQAVAAAIPGILAGAAFASRWTPGPSAPASEPLHATAGRGAAVGHDPASDVASRPGDAPATAANLRPMIPLGQFRDTFIIAVDDEGIAIVDQHVAHERVLFERIMERLTLGGLESQRLLMPMLLDLPPSAYQALIARGVELQQLGFELESFGEATVKVGAVPGLLSPSECEKALRALAEDLDGLDRGAAVQDALKRLAATMACHAAVKANDPLTYEKMTYILDELRATAYSTVCPHGRPVMLRLTRREVEKNFERI